MPYGVPNSPLTASRNVVINGGADVAQRGPGPYSIGPGIFGGSTDPVAADMWRAFGDQSGVFPLNTLVVDIEQFADHPTLGAFGHSTGFTVTTAEAAIAATEVMGLQTVIEGYNLLAIWLQSTVLSFWVRSPKNGIHCVTIQNDAGTASYIVEFTVNAPNVWEQKFIGINLGVMPVAIQATFSLTTGLSRIIFPLAAGANFQGVAGWQLTAFPSPVATANQQNLVDTIGNTFRVTDVQWEPGFVATAFERIPFSSNLERCQRYYEHTFTYGTQPASATGQGSALTYSVSNAGAVFKRVPYFYRVLKRPQAIPILQFFNPDAAGTTWRNRSIGADSGAATFLYNREDAIVMNNPQVAGDVAGNIIALHLAIKADVI